jgi:hypothetical protein
VTDAELDTDELIVDDTDDVADVVAERVMVTVAEVVPLLVIELVPLVVTDADAEVVPVDDWVDEMDDESELVTVLVSVVLGVVNLQSPNPPSRYVSIPLFIKSTVALASEALSKRNPSRSHCVDAWV